MTASFIRGFLFSGAGLLPEADRPLEPDVEDFDLRDLHGALLCSDSPPGISLPGPAPGRAGCARPPFPAPRPTSAKGETEMRGRWGIASTWSSFPLRSSQQP